MKTYDVTVIISGINTKPEIRVECIHAEGLQEICDSLSRISRDLSCVVQTLKIAEAAENHLNNSTPSADHMAELHALKDALAVMPNVES